jgi:uncharacterized membrane protein YhaH (DUF805 family)
MDLVQTLFGFRGRITRRTWWLWSVLLFVLMTVAFTALLFHVGKDNIPNLVALDLSSRSLVAFLILCAIVTWMSIALTFKRLRDRDIRGFWALVPVFLGLAIALVYRTQSAGALGEPSMLVNVLGWINVGFYLWLLVQCGFGKGTPGPNRFGSDPLVAAQTS